jgi:uncharacterized membrane protein YraQ (UPF0718 family)
MALEQVEEQNGPGKAPAMSGQACAAAPACRSGGAAAAGRSSAIAARLLRVDRVWLALAGLFAGLVLVVPDQASESLRFTIDSFLWILPFLVLSVVLAAWLKAAGADRLIGRSVSRSPRRAIVLAALAGALSPFCSCGVVPLVAALMAAGLPLPTVMAFWIASPLMDPEQFILMAATLGIGFTTAKTLAAIAMGLLGGFATLGLQRLGAFAVPLKPGIGGSCAGDALSDGALDWAVWRDGARRRAFTEESLRVAGFLAKWLLLAFALESLMVAWLPPEIIAGSLGGDVWYAIPLAVAVGVPAYLNGFAAIPLVGELMNMGMVPGAALAFLTAGAVTSLPAAMAVFALVKRPVFAWYLAIALTGSLASGLGFQLIQVL